PDLRFRELTECATIDDRIGFLCIARGPRVSATMAVDIGECPVRPGPAPYPGPALLHVHPPRAGKTTWVAERAAARLAHPPTWGKSVGHPQEGKNECPGTVLEIRRGRVEDPVGDARGLDQVPPRTPQARRMGARPPYLPAMAQGHDRRQ